MDNISSGSYVENISSIDVSTICFTVEKSEDWKGENVFRIWLHVEKGEDWPKKGDILLLSSRNLKSRDQILKDDGFCTILVVKNAIKENEWNDGSKRGWISASLSKLPHGGNSSQGGLYQVMHLENLSTYECSWQVMMKGFKCSSKLINLILNKNNNGVSTSLSLSL